MAEAIKKNAMDFGKENETFSVNEDAERIIEENAKKKAQFKRETIYGLLKILNKICEKKDLKYFAIGKLLTFWKEGRDPFVEDSSYQIYMFRKDYDTMTDYLTAHEKDLGLYLKPMYYPNKMVKYATFSVTKKFHLEENQEVFDIDIEIAILPLDEVPADSAEKDAFNKEVILKNRWYHGYSRDYALMYKGNRSMTDKVKAKLSGIFHYNASFFQKQHKDLYAAVTRYNGKDTGYYGRMEMLVGRVEKKEDLLPARKVSFGDTTLMIPAVEKPFLIVDESKYVNHVRSVQTRALKNFDAFCEEHGLTYFAIGPLLIDCMSEAQTTSNELENWKVGLLREDYDKVIQLLSDKKTSGNLALKRYQDDYITVPRREAGFISKEDDCPDITGKNLHVLMEVFDYLPETMPATSEVKSKLKKMRDEYEILIQKERGALLPDSKISAMKQLKRMNKLAKDASSVSSGRVGRLITGYGQDHAISEILPVQKKDFRGFKLSVPADEYLWFDKNDQGFTDAVTIARTEVLKVLDQICQEHEIEYFAIADLLVGAVIYHDTIPNKAGVNAYVGLVRDQYEKLLKLLREEGEKYQLVLTEYLDKEKKYPVQIRYISFPGKENGKEVVYLSAFDKLPESFYLRRSFKEELKVYNKQYQEMLNFNKGNIKKYRFMYSEEEIEQKRVEYMHTDALALAEKIETLAQKYNEDEQAYSYARNGFVFSKTIDVEDLYPLGRVEYRGVEISCPRDYSVWQPIQDENLLFQVKCIQEMDKKLMVELDRVCQELGVGYFICGGTMLGYMRHKGFIPWDDDVDVAMLRADYDRFIKEAGPLFGEGYFLQTRESDPNIPYLFSKLRIDDTEYITEWNKDKNFHKGLCLDIFPFDYVPNDLQEREAFVEEVRQLSKEHNAIANEQFGDVPEPFPPRNEEEAQKIAEVKATIQSWNEIDLKDSQERYLAKATMYNSQAEELDLKTVASFVPTYTFIDLADLLPYQRGIFEDVEISVPKRPDIFLEMQYGDYMQLPPLHARVAHRLVRWSDGVNGADNEKKRIYQA